jgi:hypothetical protein
MYSINNFVEFTGQPLKDTDIVLVWSKSTGYIFIPYSKFNSELNLVGV